MGSHYNYEEQLCYILHIVHNRAMTCEDPNNYIYQKWFYCCVRKMLSPLFLCTEEPSNPLKIRPHH